jgi:hypothetical protein
MAYPRPRMAPFPHWLRVEGQIPGQKLLQMKGRFPQNGAGHFGLHQAPACLQGVLEVGLHVRRIQRKSHPPLRPRGGSRGEGILAHHQGSCPLRFRPQGCIDPCHPCSQDQEVCFRRESRGHHWTKPPLDQGASRLPPAPTAWPGGTCGLFRPPPLALGLRGASPAGSGRPFPG